LQTRDTRLGRAKDIPLDFTHEQENSMELKYFISQALTAIAEGVAAAQAKTAAHGAFINPGGLTRPTKSIADDAIGDNSTNKFARCRI
jgi:hypothetical protein